MTPEPFPTQVAAPLGGERSVEEHRNLFCQNYDNCLNHVVKEGWAGWTCTRCPLFADHSGNPAAGQFAHERRTDSFTR